MKKLLITGFEPFDGESVNPSWEAVKLLPDTVGEWKLIKLCIPVVFGLSADTVVRTADENGVDAVLSIGQAGGRDAVTPEFVGINLRHASIPDNNGNKPIDEPIINGGDTAYFATVPAREMVAAINALGISAKPSYSAGAYVCNDVLYTLLAHFEGTDTRVGFIHVPYESTQAKPGIPSMPICDMVRALSAAIKAL